LGQKKYMCGK